MVEIDTLQQEIVERLKPLNPDKIILFGSYAYGEPDEESDIDLFVVKDVEKDRVRKYKVALRKSVQELVSRYGIGFDFVVASEKFLRTREDYFYRKEILERGKVLYE